MNYLKQLICLYIFKKKWRKRNIYNFTRAKTIFPMDKVNIGNDTYGELNFKFFGGANEYISIGNYVSIGPNVYFCAGGEHALNHLMTYPFYDKYYGKNESISKGPIIIEDDVWIGCNVTILSGVRIGKGAVIAAGSVIHKDIPPYAIVCSNRIIKYRFEQTIIDELLKFEYNNLDRQKLKTNINKLTVELTKENIKEVLDCINDCYIR